MSLLTEIDWKSVLVPGTPLRGISVTGTVADLVLFTLLSSRRSGGAAALGGG